MARSSSMFVLSALISICAGCGPHPPPENAYTSAPALLDDLESRRGAVESLRIVGRVDHFGKEHRVQGKLFLFANLPAALRIELVSPFSSPLAVLTVNGDSFSLHDLREGRYFTGPAEPCNIARLVRIPLPPGDVSRILVGHTPLIEGVPEISWNEGGFYRVIIREGDRTQTLDIGPTRNLPLRRSTLEDGKGTIFELTFDRWRAVSGVAMPHEIKVVMPRHQANLVLRYDDDGVELNLDLPPDAWDQSPPAGVEIEKVSCD